MFLGQLWRRCWSTRQKIARFFFGKCKTKKEIILTLNLNPKCCSMAPEMKLFSRDEDHHRQQLSSLLIFCRFFLLFGTQQETKKNLNNPRWTVRESVVACFFFLFCQLPDKQHKSRRVVVLWNSFLLRARYRRRELWIIHEHLRCCRPQRRFLWGVLMSRLFYGEWSRRDRWLAMVAALEWITWISIMICRLEERGVQQAYWYREVVWGWAFVAFVLLNSTSFLLISRYDLYELG